jgi:hypothetical protein
MMYFSATYGTQKANDVQQIQSRNNHARTLEVKTPMSDYGILY